MVIIKVSWFMNIIEHGVMLKIIFNLPKRLKIYGNIPNIFSVKNINGARHYLTSNIKVSMYSLETYLCTFKIWGNLFLPSFLPFFMDFCRSNTGSDWWNMNQTHFRDLKWRQSFQTKILERTEFLLLFRVLLRTRSSQGLQYIYFV